MGKGGWHLEKYGQIGRRFFLVLEKQGDVSRWWQVSNVLGNFHPENLGKMNPI